MVECTYVLSFIIDYFHEELTRLSACCQTHDRGVTVKGQKGTQQQVILLF